MGHRKTFAEILGNAGVDAGQEYVSLWRLFYGGGDDRFLDYDDCSLADLIDQDFLRIPFRGSATSLEDFDSRYGFPFATSRSLEDACTRMARFGGKAESPDVTDDERLDTLVTFCEYVYNLAEGFTEKSTAYSTSLFTQEWENERAEVVKDQVMRIVDKLDLMTADRREVKIFVPADETVRTAVGLMEPESAGLALSYGHHSMRGDLNAKRSILQTLAQKVEHKRDQLKSVSSAYASDLFYLLNNLDIRHDNSGETPPFSKAPGVASLDAAGLEEWYDKTYRMCLGAFILCDYGACRDDIDSLKKP